MTKPFIVEFQPACVHVVTTGESTIMELARSLGIALESSCGGRGSCHSCVVRFEKAAPPPSVPDIATFTGKELAAGWRRACQTKPIASCTVHLPSKSTGAQFSAGKEVDDRFVPITNPIWKSYAEGNRRRGKVQRTIHDGPPLGLAIDLGTTNISAALINLLTGDVIASSSMTNPQVAFGADVISRLEYALKGDQQYRQVQQLAVGAISDLTEILSGGNTSRVCEVAVVGNTVMQHLLVGLPIESLSRAPYSPAVLDATEIPAAELGFAFHPDAHLYCAPNVAGFVGGDHLAAVLDVRDRWPTGRWAMLDIGTNTEIALFVDGEITSVSCASGPAFEGGKITCGMRAAPGAIDRVTIGDRVELSTVSGKEPVGICGSGVLSLVASLKRAGIVDRGGRIQLGHKVVRERDSSREIVLYENNEPDSAPIVFTQNDVRAVQLAKAAIRTGLDLLLSDAGITVLDLDRIVIAGAFGKFVDVDDAILIGLLPEIPAERIVQVGNSAGTGVRRIVACQDSRDAVSALANQIRYLELARISTFQTAFAFACRL